MDEKKFLWIKKVVIDRPSSPIRFWEVDMQAYTTFVCMLCLSTSQKRIPLPHSLRQ